MQHQLKNNLTKDTQVLKSEEIVKQYSALRVPSDFIGISYPDVGYLNIKNALNALRSLSEKYGAKLLYSSQLVSYDSSLQEVKIKRDQETMIIRYKDCLVMTTGPYTPEFRIDPQAQVIEVETIKITDPSGLPTVCRLNGEEHFFSLPYKQGEAGLKIGTHGERSFKQAILLMKKYMPSKVNCLGEAQPCYYTNRKEKGLQIFREGSVVWAYGFSGSGFKHAPTIGKRVVKLMMKPKI